VTPSWSRTDRARRSAIRTIPVGKRVYLDGPYGTFTVGNAAALHVLIAGGVGIAPMMSIIRTFADRGDERPIILLYGSKDWESVTFREELEALKTRLNLTIVHVLTAAGPARRGSSPRRCSSVICHHPTQIMSTSSAATT
jgi:predicted ferric reductase